MGVASRRDKVMSGVTSVPVFVSNSRVDPFYVISVSILGAVHKGRPDIWQSFDPLLPNVFLHQSHQPHPLPWRLRTSFKDDPQVHHTEIDSNLFWLSVSQNILTGYSPIRRSKISFTTDCQHLVCSSTEVLFLKRLHILITIFLEI